MLKRVADIVLASIALVLAGPFLLLVAVVVRFNLGSPVLFRQTRPGLGGRPFQIVKFRSMTLERSPDGSMLPDERRLTRVGRALRMSSLDELPALINVLRGEMSLVGPRPLLMEYLPLYSAEQARRHSVRPGVTGWAQVNGRNATTWQQRLDLDVWYVDHQSFWLDLRILFLTFIRVVSRTGISQAGHATMRRFEGPGSST
ncbi:MAG: sugar transferase [Candidatus Omnitrophota bacterium]